jgi:hypothetical protein
MKTRILVCVSTCALLIAGATQAQSALNMNGNISATCTALSLSATSINLGTISDPTNPGTLNASAVNGANVSATPSITCNGGGTTLSIDANPLTGPALPTSAGSAGFSNLVNYTATINKSGASAFVQSIPSAGIANQTTAASASSATVGLIASEFSIALSGAAAAGVLIAGGYSGTVIIALTPG